MELRAFGTLYEKKEKIVPRDITINNYIKYWDQSTPTGHQIKIAYGTSTNLMKSKTVTINLNWPDRTRDKEGRVTTHWKK